jgi:hypothetical protein
MIRCTVDTNVPIVANGQSAPKDEGRSPSVDCRIAAVHFLQFVLRSGRILLDLEGEVQAEYRRYLNPSGQPGVGDRFYQEVLHSAPRLIERVDLPRRHDGEYADLPQALIEANFDRSDRKFAALARRERVPVVNAVDSDWLQHHALLVASGITVNLLCGCDMTR